MNNNPYAPPTAAIGNIENISRNTIQTLFFAVSIFKLAVLSVCSLGFYEVYWFCKQWHAIKVQDRSDIKPAWRSIFAVFYCYQCMARIRQEAMKAGIEASLPAGALALGWIVFSLTWKLPIPYSLIAMAAVIFLMPAQSCANRINCAVAPDHNPNNWFGVWNWITVVIGGPLVLLALIGAFLAKH